MSEFTFTPNTDREVVIANEAHKFGYLLCQKELSAMQQRAEAAEAENAELTRKLKSALANECSTAERVQILQTGRSQGLAEAKSKAVPEGWRLVPIEPTDVMIGAAWRHIEGIASVPSAYRAMLAAAPSPETDIDNSRGSNE